MRSLSAPSSASEEVRRKAGILSDLRSHRTYGKPSERRKRKLNAAIRKESSHLTGMAPLRAASGDLNAARKSQDKPMVLLLGNHARRHRNREIE
jgi:hypothetical protein